MVKIINNFNDMFHICEYIHYAHYCTYIMLIRHK